VPHLSNGAKEKRIKDQKLESHSAENPHIYHVEQEHLA
jgi:hypothetical protein